MRKNSLDWRLMKPDFLRFSKQVCDTLEKASDKLFEFTNNFEEKSKEKRENLQEDFDAIIDRITGKRCLEEEKEKEEEEKYDDCAHKKLKLDVDPPAPAPSSPAIRSAQFSELRLKTLENEIILQPDVWLNDDCVQFYMDGMRKRYDAGEEDRKYTFKFRCMETGMLQQWNEGKAFDQMDRYTRAQRYWKRFLGPKNSNGECIDKARVRAYLDVIFVPINTGQHWLLALVVPRFLNWQVYIFNSLDPCGEEKALFLLQDLFMGLIRPELREGMNGCFFSEENIHLYCGLKQTRPLCGYFMLWFMELALDVCDNGCNAFGGFDFEKFRNKIVSRLAYFTRGEGADEFVYREIAQNWIGFRRGHVTSS